jgi:hypothetical protein
MYNPNRLEWHLGVENIVITPQVSVWSCQVASESFDYVFKRLAAALAKSQDHRASCGVFAFGQPNAVRRWLGLGYPVTRANQSREGGLGIEPGGSDKSLAVMRLESFKSVRCEAMTWLRKAVIEAERNFILMR